MIDANKEQEIFFSNSCSSTYDIKCSVEKTLDVLGGKWSYLIIKHLFSGKKRFGELRKMLHNVNARSLTNCLRNLEDEKVITRNIIATVPVTVEYSLTPKGAELKEVIAAMYLWGEKWTN